MEPRLVDTASRTVVARELLPPGSPVVALVSGGADSTALLRLLASGSLGELDVSVLHVNHLLRGGDAERDADFVLSLCAEIGVSCRVVRYDVGEWASAEGLNLEDAGRRVRYRFAEEELDARCDAGNVGRDAGRIATGHTFDDRMETHVMRLVQGAGPGGLAGPKYARGRIVRPLLDARHAEAIAYLESLGQTWREDATNADTSRLRARIRAEVLPLLFDINPRFDAATERALHVLGDEDALLDAMARDFAVDFAERGPGEVRFERARMLTLSRAMARRTVRLALFEAFPGASRIEFEHVEAIVDGMAEDAFSRDLPEGLRAFTEYGKLVVSRAPGAHAALAPALLEVPGTVDLGEAGVLSARPAGADEVEDDPMSALIDSDRLTGPMTVDGVRPGDRMRPLGMEGTKKLGDVLTDAKVPRRERPLVPVVRDGERVVWLAGVRMDDSYRVAADTQRAVRMDWTGPTDRKAGT